MRRLKILATMVAAASTAMGSQVFAQGLEEVVVTAQKREQSLQDAPIAIAAFDANALEQKGVSNIEDLGTSVPNVKITRSPSNTTAATIAIRGSATINPAITWEPTVGIYLDGVFIGKNIGGLFDIAELERVEMLRGPQGTLYGKNTLGGAVNLITTRPSGEFGGKVRVGFGNYQLKTGYATIDTPALELGAAGQIMAKVSGSYRTRDGLYENDPDPFGNSLANPPSSDELNNINSQVGRYDILWEVNDRLELRYTWDYSDIDQEAAKQQLTFYDPSIEVIPGATLGMLNPDAAAQMGDYLTGANDNRRRTSSDQSGYERSKSISQSLFVSYDVGTLGMLGDVTLRYIGNDRKLNWDDLIDIDGTPLDVFHSVRDIAYEQTSHEFQIIGQTDRTNYVLGLYYFNEEADVYNPISFLPVAGFGTSRNSYGFDNDSIAVFGQIDWRPSAAVLQDRLTLTAGLRWTKEEKDTWIDHPDDVDASFAPAPWSAHEDKTYTNLSPTFVAAWDVNDSVNVYGKLAYGWKSGGFNGEAPFEAAFVEPYDAEEMQSIEFGMKSRWLDNRLQVNTAVFQNESDDMQMSIFIAGGGASSVVQNAGKATIRGFEVEVIALPIPDLQLSLNYGYLDAKYDEFIDNGVDQRKNKDFPYTPRHSGSLSAEYTFFQSGWGELIGRVDYEYVDEHVPYIEPFQNATSKVNTYQLVNARLTLADIPVGSDQRLSVALWGKNLTDKEYRVNTIPFGAWTSSFYGDPRTYGVEATFEF